MLVPGIGGTALWSRRVGRSQAKVADTAPAGLTEDVDNVLAWIRATYADDTFREHLLGRYNAATHTVESLQPEWKVRAVDNNTHSLDHTTPAQLHPPPPMPQVSVPVDDYGLHAIDTLAPHWVFKADLTYYYHSLITRLKAIGFVPGVTLFGFPYDWRQSTRHAGTVRRMMQVIGDASKRCSCKVDVLSHSMGGLVVRAYMDAHAQHAARHVRAWTTIASPFAGAGGNALAAFVAGYDFSSLIRRSTARALAVESPAVVELAPSPLFDWHAGPPTLTWRERVQANSRCLSQASDGSGGRGGAAVAKATAATAAAAGVVTDGEEVWHSVSMRDGLDALLTCAYRNHTEEVAGQRVAFEFQPAMWQAGLATHAKAAAFAAQHAAALVKEAATLGMAVEGACPCCGVPATGTVCTQPRQTYRLAAPSSVKFYNMYVWRHVCLLVALCAAS